MTKKSHLANRVGHILPVGKYGRKTIDFLGVFLTCDALDASEMHGKRPFCEENVISTEKIVSTNIERIAGTK
ncbi:hypothetical protein Y032_0158g3236 [Ancylostoma ceylanicum]|uniref:Uncharacterized protein n=1 Tax=Ancylostoma ceylanicum TaxID=53326 RepID=A0A016SYR7_9BILA|nr:hypothetical protein Y032_0158g3236 [Ancylostoma ceylanicum]